MSQRHSRRQFLQGTAYSGIAIWIGAGAHAQGDKSPNERVNFACIGVSGKGGSDSGDAARLGNIVAICDVDENKLNEAARRPGFERAKKYTDYRKMLDEIHHEIDAVTVSTPDHHHAHAAIRAMDLGKACFCQKPLTHSLSEARKMGEVARHKRVATQMGNQGSSTSGLRRSVAQVKAGAIGTVREVHVWTNRPIWPQGIPRPMVADVPANLHWDLWLGPAPERPYGEGYAPFAWRGWWDFGTGALGDMACHTVNMPFRALNLRDPIAVTAESDTNNHDSYPKWSQIKFEFAATHERPAVNMTWYDGGKLPPKDLLDVELSDSGSLIIGDKGKLYTPGDYGDNGHINGGVDVQIVESPGHFDEFVRAIKGGEPAMSNFPEWAVPLTETILLGNLAVWAGGKRIEWDAHHLRATNAPEVMSIVHPTYRAGYSI
jgi:predicted dehydrogenase